MNGLTVVINYFLETHVIELPEISFNSFTDYYSANSFNIPLKYFTQNTLFIAIFNNSASHGYSIFPWFRYFFL